MQRWNFLHLRQVRRSGVWKAFWVAAVGAVILSGCAKPEEKAEAYLKKGLQLIAEKNDLDARLELLNSIKYKADNVAAWRALAGVNERTGATNLYVQNLRRVIELDPADNQAKISLAKLMLRGNATAAAQRVIESVAGQEENAEFHALKAGILAAHKDAAGALAEARRAVEIDPTNADALIILASERVARGDAEAALQLLNRAKVTDPKDTRVSLAKIQLSIRGGDLAAAETELRGIVTANPKDFAARAQLAQVLTRQRKFDAAEAELRAIADGNPDDAKPALDVIRFLMSVGGPAAARQELENKIKKGGEVFSYQMALADLEINQKNLGAAAQILERQSVEAKSTSDKDTAKVKLAEIKASQKDIAGAERLITEVLATDRRQVGALRLRAAVHLDRAEIDSAIADLREALQEQPKDADLLLLIAQAYERSGQVELAERQYSEATRAAEYNPAITLRYLAFLQRSDNPQRAETVLTEALRRNPASIDIASSLARVRLSRKNWTGALEIADQLAKHDATRALGDQLRAAALAGQNKPEDSVAALERAHATAPDSLGPVSSLVRAYVTQKSFDKAEKLLSEMLEKNPASLQLQTLLAQVQLAKGAPAAAQQTLEQAIVRDPRAAGGYISLAGFYSGRKNPEKSLEVLEKGLKEAPDNIELRLAKAGVLESKGQHDSAIIEFEAIVKDQPGSVVAMNNLASLLLEYRTDKESLDRAQALVERLKSVKAPQILDTVGWATHLRGDPSSALPLLEQARLSLPNVAAIRYHLAMVYRALGQEQKATEELRAGALLETDETILKRRIRAAMN